MTVKIFLLSSVKNCQETPNPTALCASKTWSFSGV